MRAVRIESRLDLTMIALVPIVLCCRTGGRGVRTRPTLSLHRPCTNKYLRPGRMIGVEIIKAIHVSIGDEWGIDITRWNRKPG